MSGWRTRLSVAILTATLVSGCDHATRDRLRIGVAFETLQTEYWVASFEALKAELERRDIEMIEAIADNDANRQLDQIHIFIARGVDGIIVAPRDATTVIPMIRAANAAGIPMSPSRQPWLRCCGWASSFELYKARRWPFCGRRRFSCRWPH